MIGLPKAVNHSPPALHQALAGTSRPVSLDIESTGLGKAARTVSVACLVDDRAFVLPVRSLHATVCNIALPALRHALAPLGTRTDLVVIGHNLAFDRRILAADGIHIVGEVRDTMKLLKLIDPDRGASDKQRARLDRRDPPLLL